MQSAVLATQNLLGSSSSGISQMLQKLIPKNPIEQMYEGFEAQGITPGEEVRAFRLGSLSVSLSLMFVCVLSQVYHRG